MNFQVTLNDRQLSRCALRELRQADLASIQPPGTAYIALHFTNSAAEGVAETASRIEARAASVDDVTAALADLDTGIERVRRAIQVVAPQLDRMA